MDTNWLNDLWVETDTVPFVGDLTDSLGVSFFGVMLSDAETSCFFGFNTVYFERNFSKSAAISCFAGPKVTEKKLLSFKIFELGKIVLSASYDIWNLQNIISQNSSNISKK